eukprot:TRINITY_DN9980_c0_g1_i1.p1 TRINITY_DN9980_c0_g1~~TRINITY_DN9980_c0_g1_i1.p1  ORF type:complete len:239 (+),score=104.91 TRINITY_DN9980_c0_g1_i1:146-862(+)
MSVFQADAKQQRSSSAPERAHAVGAETGDRLGSLLDEFTRVMSSEQQRLSDTRKRLNDDIERFDEEKARMAELHHIQESIIELNVGGVRYTVAKATLCRFAGSLLESMFGGRHAITKDSKGRYFIDRNGRRFEWLLDFLREPFQFVPPADPDERQRLLVEADYFGLDDLVAILQESDKPAAQAAQPAVLPAAPVAAYCDASCFAAHPNKLCRVCHAGWGPHVGHSCPGTNNRGSFPLN